LWVAITHLLWHALTLGSWRLTLRGLAAALGVTALYFSSYAVMDRLLAKSVSHQFIDISLVYVAVLAFAGTGFVALFALQAAARWRSASPLMAAIYVHATNGFYLDIPARRLTAWVWRGSGPTP
jgi:NAD(P)H-quinone oxidoreductase subunit 5